MSLQINQELLMEVVFEICFGAKQLRNRASGDLHHKKALMTIAKVETVNPRKPLIV